jgi:NTP pyrophosphatase (non-canonical NTP hydrolase)
MGHKPSHGATNRHRPTMTFDEYQAAAARTLNPALEDRDRLLDAAAGLAEEAGEVLAEVRKHAFQGRPLDLPRVREELGDLLWCAAAVAASLGISLGSAAAGNVEKLRRRHPDGFTPRGAAGTSAPPGDP